ncbi:hypothetical protein BGW80DRAFT_548873 [Lactifluus volemus]|nr:hypothetical protein BGW80DRAFT_548873 [Lactifluus volemus]
MALAHYSPFLDQPLPIQSKHPYLLSVAQKQVLPMSNPYSWNKSTSGLESWDAPQTSWTIDSSYLTLQSAVPPSEPTTSQAASGAHPLQQHPLPEPRCDSSLSRLELGHLPSHSPGLRGLDPTSSNDTQESAQTVEEAGPLEEEGCLFEFQLRLGDTPPPSSPPVRSTSTLPESRTTSPGNDWMGRTRPPSEVGNRRIVETPGTADDWDWSYPLPTELSQPFTLPPGVVECREPAGVDTSGTHMGLGELLCSFDIRRER